MKKILITGANSYIGMSFEKYINENYPNDYVVDTVDMIDGTWREKDFSGYDSVFHVAAIVHTPNAPEDLYYKVNRDLAIEIAVHAKNSGVEHFVLMSSMSVFGKELGAITSNTEPHPDSAYGKSKLEADNEIERLNCEGFKVAIIRAPMIYGKGCKGNYNRMEAFALKSPIFPSISNKRDMMYIGNLVDYIKYIIDNSISGILYPRDSQLVSTSRMVKLIADANNHKICFWGIFNPFVKLFMRERNILGKVFGDSYCEIDNHLNWMAPYNLEAAINEIYDLNNQGNLK